MRKEAFANMLANLLFFLIIPAFIALAAIVMSSSIADQIQVRNIYIATVIYFAMIFIFLFAGSILNNSFSRLLSSNVLPHVLAVIGLTVGFFEDFNTKIDFESNVFYVHWFYISIVAAFIQIQKRINETYFFHRLRSPIK